MVKPASNPSKPNLFVGFLEVALGPLNDTDNCYHNLARFDYLSRNSNTILISSIYTKQFNIYIDDLT